MLRRPIEALRKVGRYVGASLQGCKWRRAGLEWGREMPLREGDVGMENFCRTLDYLASRSFDHRREIPQDDPAEGRVGRNAVAHELRDENWIVILQSRNGNLLTLTPIPNPIPIPEFQPRLTLRATLGRFGRSQGRTEDKFTRLGNTRTGQPAS